MIMVKPTGKTRPLKAPANTNKAAGAEPIKAKVEADAMMNTMVMMFWAFLRSAFFGMMLG